MHEDEKQPFTAHLEELRKRLIICLASVAVGFGVAYAFKEKLFIVLVAPLQKVMRPGDTLVYTHLPEAFFTLLKTSLMAGIMLAFPVILYQFWRFVAPGLYDKEKKLFIPILSLSILFFLGGVLFGYFIVLPLGFKFFLSFATDTVRPMPAMKEYLGLTVKLLLAFGLIFELPLVITFLSRIGVINERFLRKNRKYAILIFFIVAAILTPPDVLSQVLMALPLMVLYEISILGARFFSRGKEADLAQGEENPPEAQG